MERTMTLVASGGGITAMETVKLEDAWWLVCSWSDGLHTRPKRAIRLTGLPFEEVKGQPYRFVLSRPLPAGLAANQHVQGFHVRDLP
jgi:hypothetical protein